MPEEDGNDKVTLYLPKKLTREAKDYAKENDTSLSRVVTELLEKKVKGKVMLRVEVTDFTYTGLKARAEREGVTPEQLVARLATE